MCKAFSLLVSNVQQFNILYQNTDSFLDLDREVDKKLQCFHNTTSSHLVLNMTLILIFTMLQLAYINQRKDINVKVNEPVIV